MRREFLIEHSLAAKCIIADDGQLTKDLAEIVVVVFCNVVEVVRHNRS